ncbi:MAG: hypothetical protein M1839_008558 [Geoglossum umbratile]|nr:MAG: hypothetical protein M1839_008558 [Geoglossum umbratile]
MAANTNLDSWDTNAASWDSYMGPNGNHFVTYLELPSLSSLLSPRPGEHALDLATGNGLVARWLAEQGCAVSASDGSAEMVRIARDRVGEDVRWSVVNLADEAAFGPLVREALELGGFDVISLNMAIMSLDTLVPLANALPKLLKPRTGRFAAALLHPAFMTLGASRRVDAVEDSSGNRGFEHKYSVEIRRYLDVPPGACRAVPGLPVEATYFHRPLHALFAPFFAAGLVLDGLEEPGFKAGGDVVGGWDKFSQIPPILVFRLRWMGGRAE